MRELNINEIEIVSGGVGVIGRVGEGLAIVAAGSIFALVAAAVLPEVVAGAVLLSSVSTVAEFGTLAALTGSSIVQSVSGGVGTYSAGLMIIDSYINGNGSNTPSESPNYGHDSPPGDYEGGGNYADGGDGSGGSGSGGGKNFTPDDDKSES